MPPSQPAVSVPDLGLVFPMPRMAVPASSWKLGALADSARKPGIVVTEKTRVRVVTVAEGLVQPWGMAFLPDGRLLVTEKPGRLRIVDDAISVIKGSIELWPSLVEICYFHKNRKGLPQVRVKNKKRRAARKARQESAGEISSPPRVLN